MKTHRQALIEKLDNEFGKTVNATQVTIGHLLLLCDMLDEREREQGQTAFMRANNRTILDMQSGEHCRHTPMADRLQGNMAHAVVNQAQWQCDAAQFPDGTKKVETPANPNPNVHNVSANLVNQFTDWIVVERSKQGDFETYNSLRDGVRHAFSELAKTPCELLTVKAIELAIVDAHERKQYDLEECAAILRQMFVDAVAPILAAKDARIAELDVLASDRLASFQGAMKLVLGEAEKVAKLETQIAALEQQRDKSLDALTESKLVPPGRTVVEAIEEILRQCAIGMERLAEFTAPVDVDGKTPGQVADEGYAACDGSRTESWEAAGNAVLRAFGNGVETLKLLRATIANTLPAGFIRNQSSADDVIRIIDAEIAKLGETPQIISKEDARRIIDNDLAGLGTPFDDVPKNKQSNVLRTLREQFTHTPEPGDGDDGKWVRRVDVLNAIDEIAKLA